MSEALEPCPFCGGDAEVVSVSTYGHSARCPGCYVEGDLYDTEAQAVAAWNTRAPDARDARIAELEAGLRTVHDAAVVGYWDAKHPAETAAFERIAERANALLSREPRP